MIIHFSLWGKFSQRNTLCKNKIFTSACDFLQLMLDQTMEIHQIVPINQDVVRVAYRELKDYIQENDCSNIIVSLWTTRFIYCY